MVPTDAELRFVPSRVEGLPDVSEVAVHPDRLEVVSAGRSIVVRFVDIAKGHTVAERDWFHAPPDRFFRFYTDPAVTVYMPADEPYERARSTFLRVQEVLWAGGFQTFDLG